MGDRRFQGAALRCAVYRANGSVVELVRGRLTDDVLQFAGDGLLDAVAQNIEGEVEVAARVRSSVERATVGRRRRVGRQLDAALGTGVTPLLRRARAWLAYEGLRPVRERA